MAAQVSPSWLKLKSHIQSIYGFAAQVTIGNIVALIMFVVLSATIVLIVDDLTRDVAIIEPIAVPKALADAGYTPEVAGHRLRDALQQLADAAPEGSIVDETNAANSILAHNVAARDELPDFVVPQIGLSLSAIVSSIRSVAQYTRGGKVISGELIFRDNYALRVRVDGREVFNSGFESDNPDDLLDRAAPVIVTKLWPALGATVLYRTRPDQALRDADDIIATFEESDPNVLEAFILKGDYFSQHEKYDKAEKMFRKAISLNSRTPSLYNRLGLALQRQGNFQDALKEFQRVVSINPKSAEGYNNIGAALVADQVRIAKIGGGLNQAKLDEARKNYQRAIALRPNDVGVHNNLGLVWKLQNNPESAISEFYQAIEIDRNYLYGHWNLAAVLADQNRFDDALAEYRTALVCTQAARDLALIHIHIGNTLKSKAGAEGNLDEAIAEYRRAVEIDPFYAWTHNSLAESLRDQGKIDEAIAEYRAALQSPHTDDEAIKAAKDNLEQAVQARERARMPRAQKQDVQFAPKEAQAAER